MRITGGRFRKALVSAVSDERTRYTPSIVREALFNMIDAEGAEMLELFAGSGIVTAEAMSRDLGKATVVEISRQSCSTIKKNLKKLGRPYQLLGVDFRIALRRLAGKGARYDIVFADPPFGTGLVSEAFKELDRHSDVLKDTGIIVIESSEREIPPDSGKSLSVNFRKKYGDVVLSFYSSGHDEDDAGEKKDEKGPADYDEGVVENDDEGKTRE